MKPSPPWSPRNERISGGVGEAAAGDILRAENERLKAAINYFDRNSHEDNWPQQAERLCDCGLPALLEAARKVAMAEATLLTAETD